MAIRMVIFDVVFSLKVPFKCFATAEAWAKESLCGWVCVGAVILKLLCRSTLFSTQGANE
jgi:hypothetical protein